MFNKVAAAQPQLSKLNAFIKNMDILPTFLPCPAHETGNLGFPGDIPAFTNHTNKNYVARHSLALCMLTLRPPKAQNPVFPTETCQIFAILPKFLQNLC